MSTALSIPYLSEPSDSDVFERATQLVEQSGRVPTITDPETASRAGDLAKFLKVAGTKVNELRDLRVRPLNQEVKQINASFKPLSDAIESARKDVIGKITAFQLAEDKRRREDAETARLDALRIHRAAEAEALRKAAEAEESGDSDAAAEALEAAVAVADAPVPTTPAATSTISRGDYGSTTSLRDNWQANVTDFAALPDTFKVTNEAALRGLKGTRPTIPGVEWVNNRVAVAR